MLPGEVPTEVRRVRQRTCRQCFLDCSGALSVAMGSDPGNPEWFPRWDLGALLIRSALILLGELGKGIIHFPSSSTSLYLQGQLCLLWAGRGVGRRTSTATSFQALLSSLRDIRGLEQFRERGCRLPQRLPLPAPARRNCLELGPLWRGSGGNLGQTTFTSR